MYENIVTSYNQIPLSKVEILLHLANVQFIYMK